MFHLVRYFSIASLVFILVIALLLGYMYRDIAHQNLMEMGENKNETLSKVFANSIWPYYSSFVPELESMSADQIRQHPITSQLKRDIARDTLGVDVIKVKIYTKKGLTLFSTDVKQIGSDKSKNPDFLKALRGETATEYDFRAAMPALDGSISDRHLIASYIPVVNFDTDRVESVFELYSDVTSLYQKIEDTEYKIHVSVIVLFSMLFLALFTLIKRADLVIKGHEARLRATHEEAELQALHDPLTGLPNRFLLKDRLDHAMRLAVRNELLVAVLFIDLDRFKSINDSMGHAVGDTLLTKVARRLKAAVRDSDTVARIGGDEFILVLECINNVDHAEQVAKRVLESMSESMEIKGHPLFVTASIGITFYPFDEGSVDLDELIKNADAAMYEVKQSGRNTYQMFTHNMRFTSQLAADIEQRLHPALRNEEFELFFQPLLDTRSGRVCSLEGLIRWNHPQKGLVSPLDFIPALEKSGLIVEVGQWIIEEACRTVKMLEKKGYDDVRVGINISPKQIHNEDFVATVMKALKKYAVDPTKLDFEITESVLIENTDQVIAAMKQIRSVGITFSIDDFGVGYSSLNYLKRIPVQTIKIDRGFVSELTTSADDAAILQAIVALATSLKLNTVAEGVETEDQHRFILRKDVDFVQGFLMCKPLPIELLLEQLTHTESGTWLISRLRRQIAKP